MTAIAVTGHLNLTEPTVPLVRAELRRLLSGHRPGTLTGLSCLAPGADTLFAEEVLAAGGRLLAAAAEVLVLPRPVPDDAAYQAANAELLRRADLLVAVWDGGPGNGRGGTADMVAAAGRAGVPVEVVWPAGAARAA
jgi:hypothetical protein